MSTELEGLEPTNGQHPVTPIKDVPVYFGGLTKREYFAAMAMQGILANPNKHFFDSDALAAEWSVKMADKLINKLNQTK